MRRCQKDNNSTIYKENLKYKVGGNNKRLAELLKEEQKGFCAYTDDYLGRTSSAENEHFNPTLKGTVKDGYFNYFLVHGKWNGEKSTKWEEPIMIPSIKK